VKIDELVGDKGPQIKGVISFKETDKQWALNKTNGICLKELFGRKVQEWVGKRVTLFAAMWDGEECIRVWGSPDIPEDRDVTISLPRKRPFQMTMHRVGGPSRVVGGTESSAAGGEAPDPAKSLQEIRNAATLDALAKARKTVWGVYAAANQQVPVDIEAAANDRREALEQEI